METIALYSWKLSDPLKEAYERPIIWLTEYTVRDPNNDVNNILENVCTNNIKMHYDRF